MTLPVHPGGKQVRSFHTKSQGSRETGLRVIQEASQPRGPDLMAPPLRPPFPHLSNEGTEV